MSIIFICYIYTHSKLLALTLYTTEATVGTVHVAYCWSLWYSSLPSFLPCSRLGTINNLEGITLMLTRVQRELSGVTHYAVHVSCCSCHTMVSLKFIWSSATPVFLGWYSCMCCCLDSATHLSSVHLAAFAWALVQTWDLSPRLSFSSHCRISDKQHWLRI
jgi:hypothetical protein